METHQQKAKNISAEQITRMKILRANGVGVREIARRMNLAPSTVCRILHGKFKLKRFKRCPQCGSLIKTKTCLYCRISKEAKVNTKNKKVDNSSELKLELRPEELARYWQVRPLVEARYAAEAALKEASENVWAFNKKRCSD